jgi:hypothetical protein
MLLPTMHLQQTMGNPETAAYSVGISSVVVVIGVVVVGSGPGVISHPRGPLGIPSENWCSGLRSSPGSHAYARTALLPA